MANANPKASQFNSLKVDSGVDCGCTADCAGLVPKFTWVTDIAAETLTITDTSTIPAGDSISKLTVYVRQDSNDDWTTDEAAPYVIDTSVFDPQKDLQVRLRVVTTNGCIDYVDTFIKAGWSQGNQNGEGNWELYPPY